LQNWSYDSEE